MCLTGYGLEIALTLHPESLQAARRFIQQGKAMKHMTNSKVTKQRQQRGPQVRVILEKINHADGTVADFFFNEKHHLSSSENTQPSKEALAACGQCGKSARQPSCSAHPNCFDFDLSNTR